MMAIYRALLALYPREYQALFAKEMLKAFKESLNDVRLCGRCRLVWFVAVECCDLIVECGVQWGVKLRHNVCHRCAPGDCRCLPDIAKARPPWVGRDAHYENLSRVLASKE